MSIFRSFVHWYVWWGRNALYYYSRPFVWAVEWFAASARERSAIERQILERQAKSWRVMAKAFQRDVAVGRREYMKALTEARRQTEIEHQIKLHEQLARESTEMSESILEANKESARLELEDRL